MERHRFIDCHVHFFDPDWPGGIVWPAPDSALYKRHLPEEYLSACRGRAPDGVILVETSQRPVDDERLFAIARETDLIAGVIANLQPTDSGFAERVSRRAGEAKFKGVRLRPIDGYDLAAPALHKTLGVLAEYGLVLEAGVKTLQRLRAFERLAAQLPALKCVLIHAGHPSIDGGAPSTERDDLIHAFAAHPNTWCKVTPMAAFAVDTPPPSDVDYYRPHLDLLWSAFGADRLVYGSNWPNSTLLGDTARHIEVFKTYLSERPEADGAFFGGAARRLYNVR